VGRANRWTSPVVVETLPDGRLFHDSGSWRPIDAPTKPLDDWAEFFDMSNDHGSEPQY
jgi:hypothetical protein